MDRTLALVGIASSLRRAWQTLSEATKLADELKMRQLMLDIFDLELEALKLHHQVLEAAAGPRLPAPTEDLLNRHDELPF